MNIYLIVRGFPTKNDPQWGSFELDQAQALAAQGHKVTMLSVDVRWKSRNRKFQIKRNETLGVISYDLYCGPWVVFSLVSSNLYDFVVRWLFMILFKRVLKREGRPDVIYSHYLDSSDYAIPIKNKYKIPVVGLEHWSELGKVNPCHRAIKKAQRVYPQLDRLLVVSNALKENIQSLIGISSEVLPNIIGADFILNLEGTRTHGIVSFVSTGNLVEIKRMDMIIKSLATVISKGYNVEVTIVGDGQERESLQSLAHSLNISNHVNFTGRITRSEIVSILNNSDVYILASSSETFGVAAAEALACGLPIIATDCGGPRDFMSDINGIMIPVNDEEKLTEAMIHMTEHYKDYDRSVISNDFHKRFSAEAVANQLTNIFNQVCKK